MTHDPESLLPIPCIACGRPSRPGPGEAPTCSERCAARLAGNVARIAELLLLADRADEPRRP